MGAEVAEAGGGRAAVDAAAVEPFDCILMDLRMPGVSGADALAEIRDGAGPNQDVPILAFTADADLGCWARARLRRPGLQADHGRGPDRRRGRLHALGGGDAADDVDRSDLAEA
jgi:CheY-like chemotaxis protein